MEQEGGKAPQLLLLLLRITELIELGKTFEVIESNL